MEYQSKSPYHRIEMPLSSGYSPLWYGFIDESGDPAPYSPQPLVLVAMLTQSTRELELVIRRAFKKTGRRLRGGELKASNSNEHIITQILKGISLLPVSIFAIAVDKPVVLNSIKDTEALYSWAMARLIRNCLEQHSRLELHLDKRYSNVTRRLSLERYIRDELFDMQRSSLVMVQEDSMTCKPLQAVDFVAWAAGKFFQGNADFWNIVAERVECFEILGNDRG